MHVNSKEAPKRSCFARGLLGALGSGSGSSGLLLDRPKEYTLPGATATAYTPVYPGYKQLSRAGGDWATQRQIAY